MIKFPGAKWAAGLFLLAFSGALLSFGLYRLRDGARAAVEADQRAVVSAIRRSGLPFLEPKQTLVPLPAVLLTEAPANKLCSWLWHQGGTPELERMYGDGDDVPYFVRAYVPRRDDTYCDTDAGEMELVPAVYVAVRAPLPAKGQVTYLRISLSDGPDTLHFGARINPEELVDRKRRYAVVPYELANERDFLWNPQPQSPWLRAWRPAKPASSSFQDSVIRLRLRPGFQGETSSEKMAKLRVFAARRWQISAEMQRDQEHIVGVSHELRRRALTFREIAAKAGDLALDRCIEMRLIGAQLPSWRASERCSPTDVGGWSGLASIATALIDGDLVSDRIESTEDGRVLELRFPRQVLIQRLADDLGGLVWFSLVVAGTGLGVWAYLRRGLRNSVKTLATAAQHDDVPPVLTGSEKNLLAPLASSILKSREQRAELQSAQHLTEEKSRAFQSTAGAFRHELTEFVSASILVLQRGPLSETVQANLLSNARLAHLIIKKIDAIRRKEPLKALSEELQGTTPEWIPLRTIFEWWKRQFDPELLNGQIRVRDAAAADVWAAIGPVIWIMTRFQENAFRHGASVENSAKLRVGVRRMPGKGYVAITFTNFADDFEPEDAAAVFDINRHAIRKRVERREKVDAADLSGVGLYAARQYALLTEGLVKCRYRRLPGQRATVSFSVALKSWKAR